MKHYDNPCNEFNNTIFPVENGDDGRHCHVCGWKETEHITIKGDAIITKKEETMKIMGTGSRSLVTRHDRMTIYINLQEEILRLLAKYPALHLISGMAEGWDEAIAKIAMRNNIPYTVMIPNNGYGKYYWGKNSLLGTDRTHAFNELVLAASERIVVCQSLYVDGVHANFVRNQAMVDACDGALVFDATSSGTRDAVERLKKANKPYKVYPFG